jgi:hypothetical protein
MPTIATVTMTSEAKRALAKTIRGLRGRLIEELGAAMERAYLLSIDAKKAQLDEAARVKRARLERAIEEQVRGHTDKGAKEAAAARLRAEVVTDAAATLLVRLVYLRLLEASGLVAVKVVTGGWASRGYRDFCEVAPELVRADETEGYAALLGLVFDELAHELPGLYGPVRMTALVPVPAATLRAVIEALNDPELATVWTDDTALGWIYQYWNDPERERLDAKLAAAKKLENHEIASKTQMFTERYMVEWLLQNTLGQMWLAMCKQHGWHAEAEASGVLDRLEERRIAWRARREAGEVALDALMPIEPGLEERWKYWVPQPLPDDAVASAPASVRDLTLLDPACGSGHFLVIACDLSVRALPGGGAAPGRGLERPRDRRVDPRAQPPRPGHRSQGGAARGGGADAEGAATVRPGRAADDEPGGAGLQPGALAGAGPGAPRAVRGGQGRDRHPRGPDGDDRRRPGRGRSPGHAAQGRRRHRRRDRAVRRAALGGGAVPGRSGRPVHRAPAQAPEAHHRRDREGRGPRPARGLLAPPHRRRRPGPAPARRAARGRRALRAPGARGAIRSRHRQPALPGHRQDGRQGLRREGVPAGQGGLVRGVPRAGPTARQAGRDVGLADDAQLDVHQAVQRAARVAAGDLRPADARGPWVGRIS